jgi:hypothetical protein
VENYGSKECGCNYNGITKEIDTETTTSENFKFYFLSIILAGLFTISLLLNVIQFFKSKKASHVAPISIPNEPEPAALYCPMNAVTLGAGNLNRGPNNDQVEFSVCDNGEVHLYHVLNENRN